MDTKRQVFSYVIKKGTDWTDYLEKPDDSMKYSKDYIKGMHT